MIPLTLTHIQIHIHSDIHIYTVTHTVTYTYPETVVLAFLIYRSVTTPSTYQVCSYIDINNNS